MTSSRAGLWTAGVGFTTAEAPGVRLSSPTSAPGWTYLAHGLDALQAWRIAAACLFFAFDLLTILPAAAGCSRPRTSGPGRKFPLRVATSPRSCTTASSAAGCGGYDRKMAAAYARERAA